MAAVKHDDSLDTRQYILFLIPTLTGGGAERVIVTLLKHLNRSMFRLSLAVIDTQDSVFLNDLPDDVEFIDLSCRRVRYALPKIVTLIWRKRPDVVFSTLGHLNLAMMMIRHFLPNKVRIIARETIVLSCGHQHYRLPKVWALLTRHFYPRVDLLVCQSRDMQQDLVDHFAFPSDKTVVIHNPVDIEFIHGMVNTAKDFNEISTDSIYLIACGRLVAQKGFDLLIEALALLRNQHVRLDIMGEGPLFGELKELVRSKGLDRQVHFVGFQANPYAWFSRADAFVLSSHYEGFPNVVLETLVCGTPIIATPAPGGVREILDDIPECVVAQELTAVSLAKAISEWLAGGQKRVSSKAVEPYALVPILEAYEKVLKR